MKRKILIVALILSSISVQSFAQENGDAPKAKKEEKVIIKKLNKTKKGEATTVIVDDNKVTVNGDDVEKISDDDIKMKKLKRITVMIDGDNVTVNGKPVDKLTDKDIELLKGNADHLGAVAPYIRGKIKANLPNGSYLDGNFEITDDDLKKVMIDEPELNKALLGVSTENNDKGALIKSVSKESGAEKAGLQKGDIVTKINDDKIITSEDLIRAIGKYKPEEKVVVVFLRDGKTKTTEAVLGRNNMQLERVFKFDNSEGMPIEMLPFGDIKPNGDFKIMHRNNKPKIGLKIQDVEEGAGVKVLEVDENTPASKAGLQKDDIISEMNGEAIKTVDDLKEKTRNLKDGETYKVKLSRNGVTQTADIKLPKKLKTADL
jgi:serine protease Do